MRCAECGLTLDSQEERDYLLCDWCRTDAAERGEHPRTHKRKFRVEQAYICGAVTTICSGEYVPYELGTERCHGCANGEAA